VIGPHTHQVGRLLWRIINADIMTHHAEIELRRLERAGPLPARMAAIGTEHVDAVLDRFQQGLVSSTELPHWARLIISLADGGPLAYQSDRASLIRDVIDTLASAEGQRRRLDDPAIAALRQHLRQAQGTTPGTRATRRTALEAQACGLLERRTPANPQWAMRIARFLWRPSQAIKTVTMTRAHVRLVLDELAADPRRESEIQDWAKTVQALGVDNDGHGGAITPELGYCWSIHAVLNHLAAPAHLRTEVLDAAGIAHLRRVLDYPDAGHHHDHTEDDREHMADMLALHPYPEDDW